MHIKIINPTISNFTVKTKYKIRRKEHQNVLYDSENLNMYLKDNHFVIADDKIKEIARRVTANKKSRLRKARAIYDYVLHHMKYDKTGKGWGRGSSQYACDIGRGNCTDFHSLFIAIARAENIPARFLIGFSLPEEKSKGQVSGYHCWAEFYINGKGWFPVDISEAWKHENKREYYFGNCCENRIGFTVGRDIELPQKDNGTPLNYFIYPYCEVDGKNYENIEKHFSFKDIQ